MRIIAALFLAFFALSAQATFPPIVTASSSNLDDYLKGATKRLEYGQCDSGKTRINWYIGSNVGPFGMTEVVTPGGNTYYFIERKDAQTNVEESILMIKYKSGSASWSRDPGWIFEMLVTDSASAAHLMKKELTQTDCKPLVNVSTGRGNTWEPYSLAAEQEKLKKKAEEEKSAGPKKPRPALK